MKGVASFNYKNVNLSITSINTPDPSSIWIDIQFKFPKERTKGFC
jgi:hypothetical protein